MKRLMTPEFIFECCVNLAGFAILSWFTWHMKWPWYSGGVLYLGITLSDFRTKAPTTAIAALLMAKAPSWRDGEK